MGCRTAFHKNAESAKKCPLKDKDCPSDVEIYADYDRFCKNNIHLTQKC